MQFMRNRKISSLLLNQRTFRISYRDVNEKTRRRDTFRELSSKDYHIHVKLLEMYGNS